MSDLAMLDRPLLGWIAGGVTPDGALDAQSGGHWRGCPAEAPPCSYSVVPLAVTGRRERWMSAAEHATPAPFCSCGLTVHAGAPRGRWLDRYRDRLGYRMQTAALAVIWGRVLVERDCVRGQYGRVLALLVRRGEPEKRRRRIELAAQELGAEVVEIDDDARPDFAALAEAYGELEGHRLEPGETAALLDREDVRRWAPTHRYPVQSGVLGTKVVILGAAAAGGGLVELGVPAATAVAAAGLPALALLTRVWSHGARGLVQVEALAPDPAGNAAGAPIALEPYRRR